MQWLRKAFRLLPWVSSPVCLVLAILLQLSAHIPRDRFLNQRAKEVETYFRQADKSVRILLNDLRSRPEEFRNFNALREIHTLPLPVRCISVFQNDRLIFWSGNKVPELYEKPEKDETFRYRVLANGYFLTRHFAFDSLDIQVYFLLKNRFSITTRYVSNRFELPVQYPEELKITSLSGKGSVVRDPLGKPLFRLALKKNQEILVLKNRNALASFFFLISLISFLGLSLQYIEQKLIPEKAWLAIFLFSGLLLTFRIVFFLGRFSSGLENFALFHPELYASSRWIPSLGDLLLHLSVLLGLLIFLYRNRHTYRELVRQRVPSKLAPILIPIIFIGFHLFSGTMLNLVADLSMNSDINLDVSQLYLINRYSIWVYGILLILIAFEVILLKGLVRHLAASIKTPYFFLLEISSIFITYWFFAHQSVTGILVPCVLGMAVIAAWVLSQFMDQRKLRAYYVGLIAISCILFGIQLNESIFQRKLRQAERLADNLHTPHDPTAGYLLASQVQSLMHDRDVRDFLLRSPNLTQAFRNRLKLEYFSGYLESYNLVELSLENGIPFQGEEDSLVPVIRQYTEDAKVGFELKIPYSIDQHADTLRLQLVQKAIRTNSPFPVLFEDRDWQTRAQFSAFSFAIYRSKNLTRQAGTFPYSINDRLWENRSDREVIREFNLTHYISRPDKNNILVITFYGNYILRFFVLGSFLFLLCLLLAALLSLINLLLGHQKIKNRITYKLRIELAIMGSSVLILVALGYITLQYTVIRSNQRSKEQMITRIQGIAAAVENEISFHQKLGEDFFLNLNQVARNFSADVSIYALNGRLLFTSQPGIFQKNLLAPYVDPEAFFQIKGLQKTVFTQEEQIGDLHYYSSYLPLSNRFNEPVAILNMPSFSDPWAEAESLNEFLANLINIYILVMLLTAILAFRFSENITRPLKLITRIISETRPGKATRNTIAQREDELGQMLLEYYRVLDELEKSAELLAKTQKEQAWREMARQVAHEIKNPLTPIKLSIQHLQRAWHDQVPDFENRLSRITQTVLEQIESLNRIAGEFSSFAQMPEGSMEEMDLLPLIESVVSLFDTTVFIEFQTDLKNAVIQADRDQINRVLNNLIKNALQAIEDPEMGRIDIELSEKENKFQVKIRDNGSGIDEAIREKIFVPNFTTKGSGMGLGLAMVKKIIEHHQGSIFFENNPEGGTIFTFLLPKSSAK